MHLMKKRIAMAALASLCCSMVFNSYAVFAASANVVINEVAWMGSSDSSADEWIELYNPTSQAVDLSNWKIVDDGANDYLISSGTIPAYGYFLIENREDAVKGVAADAVISLSLANSGDSLVLKDAADNTVDTVNSAGGAWFAGNSTGKKTMERVDATVGGDEANNWADNLVGNGAVASGGSMINGTPGALNSVSVVPQTAPKLELKVNNGQPYSGETIVVSAEVANVNDVFSYGVELNYDPTILKYQQVTKKGFLNESDQAITSFQAGLENGVAGKLIVAEARTVDPKTTVSGAGTLFEVEFEVIGSAGDTGDVTLAPGSFVADETKDLGMSFVNAQVAVQGAGGGGSGDPVTGLTAKEGANRYELELNWVAPSGGADSYKVSRKDVAGNLVEIGEVTELKFVDKDGVQHGGALIPNFEYEYQVVAVKNSVASSAVMVKAKETRGLKADANRSDRVDGRDLEFVARHFAEKVADANFDRRVDTNYDGVIDGSDLLDLTADWAKTYSP